MFDVDQACGRLKVGPSPPELAAVESNEAMLRHHMDLHLRRRPRPIERVIGAPSFAGGALDKIAMYITHNARKLLHRSVTHRLDPLTHTKHAVAESRDDMVVRQAIDGVDEVRPLAEWVGAAGPDADFQR